MEPNSQRSRSFFDSGCSTRSLGFTNQHLQKEPLALSRAATFVAFPRSAFTVAGWTTYRVFFRRQRNLSILFSPSFPSAVLSLCGASNLSVFSPASTKSFDLFSPVFSPFVALRRGPCRLSHRLAPSTVFRRFFTFFNRPADPAFPAAAWGGRRYQRRSFGQRYFDFFPFYSGTFFPAGRWWHLPFTINTRFRGNQTAPQRAFSAHSGDSESLGREEISNSSGLVALQFDGAFFHRAAAAAGCSEPLCEGFDEGGIQCGIEAVHHEDAFSAPVGGFTAQNHPA